MVGIISNNAALFAQRNLGTASEASELSIGRLSSGNKIIRAADDVSGLAVGTVLATTVSTLKTVLSSTSQANSLLSIADGGLKNVSDILQRQKALAVQANSGALSDTERAFLNEEFTNLTSEINRIVDNTTFNGISLIDGSIFDKVDVNTEIADKGTQASATITIGGAVTAGDHIVISDGTTSRQISFVASGGGGSSIDLGDGAKGTVQTALENFFQTAAQTDSFYDGLEIGSFSSDVLTIKAKNTGTAGDSFSIAAIDATGEAAATNIDISGSNGATAVSFTGGTNGDLFAGRVSYDTANDVIGDSLVTAISATAQTTAQTTITVGTLANTDAVDVTIDGQTVTFTFGVGPGDLVRVGDDADDAITLADAINGSVLGQYVNASVDPASANAADVVLTGLNPGALTITAVDSNGGNFTPVTTAAGGGSGIHVDNIVNNDAFAGNISGFEATYISDDNVSLSIKVGDITYNAVVDDTTPSIDTFVRFTSATDGIEGGGYFDVQLASGGVAITTQDAADTFAARLDSAFSTINFEQTRDVSTSTFQAVGNIYVDSTQSGTLSGASLDVNVKSFTNLAISDISVSAPAAGSSNASISITTESGEVYSVTDLTATADGNTNGASIDNGGTITLTSTTDPDQTLTFTLGTGGLTNANGDAGQAVLLDTSGQALAFEDALKDAFGIGSGNGGLNFQVGSSVADNITVAVKGAATSDIYKDDDGKVQTLSIDTAANAQAASDVLDNAINAITSIRATVGALQSRFDFASANVTSSIQNTEAARSNFLDVDIAEESTKFATSQVRLQASISVLAQANQLPQNLLKLIG